MLPLSQIKRLRKEYHLNQKQLADRAGVSQSLIAKIEANKLDPSYTKAQQIFQALEEIRTQKELKAKDVMKTKIITVTENEPIKDVIKTLKSKGISQIPVLNHNSVVGLITETTIVNKIAEHPEKITILKAGEVMEDAPPIVPLNTGLKMLLEVLKDYPIVLVAEKGEVKGIISKSDVLGRIE